MNLQEYVKKNKPVLKDFMVNFLANQDLKLFNNTEINKKLIDFATNGKMLRGLIVCLSSEMYGMSISHQTLSLASAIELNHATILMHDDILDNDRLRRGRKTIFAQYEEEAQAMNLKNPYFYGVSNGIVVGDIGYFLAGTLFGNIASPNCQKLIELFYKEMISVGLAEQYEFVAGFKAEEIDEDEIMNIYRYKTAHYTFSLPMKLGALLAGASGDQIELLDTIGEELGIIFQIIDDEIGLLGTEEEIGKPVGSDIRENKKTLVRKMLFEMATEDEKSILQNSFGNHNLGEDQIKQVQNITKNHEIDKKIIEITTKRAEGLVSRIDKLSIPDEYKNVLKEFVEYNLHRTA